MRGRSPSGSPLTAIRLAAALFAAYFAVLLVLMATSGSSSSPASPRTTEAPAVSELASTRRVVTGSPPAGDLPAVEPLRKRPARPATIAIPDAGIEGDVVGVGETVDGIVIPEPILAGWYRYGPRPGESGRSIIVGHINSLEGPALFATLGAAEVGANVEIVDREGKRHVYEVTRKLQVAKADFPSQRIYGPSGDAELVMITCGGEYDSESGFEDNVIVFARELDL